MGVDEFVMVTEVAFEKLMTPTKGVRPEVMEEPMATGKWSFKGMAAHFAHWNALVIRKLEAIHHDREFDWGNADDFDAINAAAVARSNDMPVKRVMTELRISHSALTETVKRVDAQKLCPDGKVPRWLLETVTEHYEHHLPQVEAWVARLTTEGRGPLSPLPLVGN